MVSGQENTTGSQVEGREARIVAEVWRLVEPVVLVEGMELIEVEYRRESHGWVLRLFIDQESGINVEDCAHVSDVVGDLLDVADLISSPYHLEVSSPGLNRPLRKQDHFRKELGNIIELRTVTPILNRRRFKGILKEVGSESISLDCDGELHTIPFAQVERARLCYFDSRGNK